MADQEIAKHTKKVYKIWNSKQHSAWHKIKEFLIEIIIIVFAVTISIWFHNLSEKSHDKAEAKAFLNGLQSDLKEDVEEMRQDSLSFMEQKLFFTKLADTSNNGIDSASLINRPYLFSNRTILVPNISRFEALKYSGKMKIIENKELLDEILNLYEEKIPLVVNSANGYFNFKDRNIISLLDQDMLLSGARIKELQHFIKTSAHFNYLLIRTIRAIDYILKDYHKVISQNEKLIKLIDKETK